MEKPDEKRDPGFRLNLQITPAALKLILKLIAPMVAAAIAYFMAA